MNGYLATEITGILPMLRYFNFFYHLPERSSISRPVLSYYTNLLCSLSLQVEPYKVN